MSFDEYLQEFVNRPYEDLVSIAKQGIAAVMPALKRKFNDGETASKYIILMIGACISADGTLTPLEAKFVSEILGKAFDKDVILSLAKTCNDEETRELIDGVIDSLSKDDKAALCTACISAMCADETISSREVSFIKKLFA